jgi:hypothetical protein
MKELEKMPRRIETETPKNYNWDLNQERAFWENQLSQKINFFLLFFALIIGGVALSKSKDFSLTVLFVGAVVLWFLSLTIINATRKVNIVLKELIKDDQHPTSIIDKKAKGRLIRIIVGYGLPIFCAAIVTLTFIAGISGLYSFGFPTKTEVIQTIKEGIDKTKEKIIEKKQPENAAKYFQSVDSVIISSRSQQVLVDSLPKLAAEPQRTKIQQQKKAEKPNTNFKSINKVIDD